ncbi:MAG: YggT family protein [Alphaproteobacteria bacterium]
MFIFGFLAQLIHLAIQIYVAIIILEVALNWLIALEIVNAENDAARRLKALLSRFTEPAYKHLRKYIPPIGGLDMSPLVLIIGVQVIGGLLISIFV